VPQSFLATDGSLLPSTQANLVNHMVGGSILLPGVGYIELVLGSLELPKSLTGVQFLRPCILPEPGLG